MRSRPFLFLAYLTVGLAIALPARDAAASYASPRPGLGGAAATVHFFGVFSPGMGDYDHWGYGMALRWSMSDRLAFGLDATRLSNSHESISPYSVGLVIGPGSRGALRPWVEVGAAYFRIVQRGVSTTTLGLSTAGNPRDTFSRITTSSTQDAWGPYFGAGLEWSATEHVGIFGGARVYSWKESTFSTARWDGAVGIRSGVSFNF